MRNGILVALMMVGSLAHAGRSSVGERAVDALEASQRDKAEAVRISARAVQRDRAALVAKNLEAARQRKAATRSVYAKLKSLSQRSDVQQLKRALSVGGGRVLLGLNPAPWAEHDILTLGPKGFGLLSTRHYTSYRNGPRDTVFFGSKPLKSHLFFQREEVGELDMNKIERRLTTELTKLRGVAATGELPKEWRYDSLRATYKQMADDEHPAE